MKTTWEKDNKENTPRVLRVLHLGGESEQQCNHPRGVGTSGVVCNVCGIPVCPPDLMRCTYHAPLTTDTLESFMDPAAAAYIGISMAYPPLPPRWKPHVA